MSEATLHRWTYEDLARMPEDGKRYEIIDGELFMTASPSSGAGTPASSPPLD